MLQHFRETIYSGGVCPNDTYLPSVQFKNMAYRPYRTPMLLSWYDRGQQKEMKKNAKELMS